MYRTIVISEESVADGKAATLRSLSLTDGYWRELRWYGIEPRSPTQPDLTCSFPVWFRARVCVYMLNAILATGRISILFGRIKYSTRFDRIFKYSTVSIRPNIEIFDRINYSTGYLDIRPNKSCRILIIFDRIASNIYPVEYFNIRSNRPRRIFK